MRVIPFGTSSGRPTPWRNVSGLGVDLGREWILVDCGEGTQQQIMRSSLKLSRLSAVLVTHLHGDHVLGLPGLLGTLGMEGRTAELHLVAPSGVARWLEVMCELPILGVDFPLTIVELTDDTLTGTGGEPFPVGEIGGFQVAALALRHRVPAFGYRITEPDRAGRVDVDVARSLGIAEGPDLGRLQRGESVNGPHGTVEPGQVLGPTRAGRVVTVLGDTTRCDASVCLARNADLVVHECTYAARDVALAEQWKHSTSVDAAWVARTAGARRLLVNHFSSRYESPAEVLDEARSVFEHTIEAIELEAIEIPTP